MNNEDYFQMIIQKLNAYLSNDEKNNDVSLLSNNIISSIIEVYDYDINKLNDALDVFLANQRDSKNIGFIGDNKIDISKSGDLFIKGFISKNNPMLFFYKDNDVIPYAIVKSNFSKDKDKYIVQISDKSKTLAEFKSDSAEVSNGFVFGHEFEYFEDSVSHSNKVYAKTNMSEDAYGFDMFESVPVDYRMFLKVLTNALKNNKVNVDHLSGYGFDFLFLQVYSKMREMIDESSFLSVSDLMYLLNLTLYGNEEFYDVQSKLTSYIKDIDASGEFQKKYVLSISDLNDKVVDYSIVKSEKYLSIESNCQGKKQNSVLILSTGDGFSLVVSDFGKKRDKQASFVLNFSGNKLKLKTIDDKLSDIMKDIMISFDKNGEIEFSSDEKQIYQNLNVGAKIAEPIMI